MRTIGWLALALVGCGSGSSWNDAATDAGPDVRDGLTVSEMTLVGTWARDTTTTMGDPLHIVEEFHADHTARLIFQIAPACEMSSATIDRHWHLDTTGSGQLVLDPTAQCAVATDADACVAADVSGYCTAPQMGGTYYYSISGGTMLTIEPPANGEGGTYTRQ